MAVVLGQKKVLDTKEYNDYAIGITLPLQIGDTAFNQSFTTLEQVKTNIKSVLLTKKKERLMQPLLGSGLQEILFEQNTTDIEAKIEDTVVETLNIWLPYVNVDSIIVERDDSTIDSNRINVSLQFTYNNNTNLETLTFGIQQ